MSGAGKTTLATAAAEKLTEAGYSCRLVDGDDVRAQYKKQLGFSREDIRENNRLIAEFCSRVRQDHDFIFVQVISPYRADRQRSREILSPGYFLVHVSAPLSTLRARDTKGLYAKQARGEIDNLIGASEGYPYEEPDDADLTIATGSTERDAAVESLIDFALTAGARASADAAAQY